MTGPATSSRRLVAVVHGFVQGVGFRWFVEREAERRGLAGWVANLPDGTVEVVAEGPDDQLESLIAALEEGPPGALVSHVDDHREPARGNLVDFTIRSAWHRGD